MSICGIGINVMVTSYTNIVLLFNIVVHEFVVDTRNVQNKPLKGSFDFCFLESKTNFWSLTSAVEIEFLQLLKGMLTSEDFQSYFDKAFYLITKYWLLYSWNGISPISEEQDTARRFCLILTRCFILCLKLVSVQ